MESLKPYENVRHFICIFLRAGRFFVCACFYRILVALEKGLHRGETGERFDSPCSCTLSQSGSGGCPMVELARQRLGLESLVCYFLLLHHYGAFYQLSLFDGQGTLPFFKRLGSFRQRLGSPAGVRFSHYNNT